ncbi:MAG TPA: hypothetical protein VFY45_07515, partial [Baekduia sp.]|nr:hypothetical protein [Baekduia sp.]
MPSGIKDFFSNQVVHLLLVLAGAAAGLAALGDAAGGRVAIIVGVAALLTAFARFNEAAGRIVGGAISGVLVLLGFNFGLHALGVDHIGIVVGLVLAALVFGVTAAWYIRGRTGGDGSTFLAGLGL